MRETHDGVASLPRAGRPRPLYSRACAGDRPGVRQLQPPSRERGGHIRTLVAETDISTSFKQREPKRLTAVLRPPASGTYDSGITREVGIRDLYSDRSGISVPEVPVGHDSVLRTSRRPLSVNFTL